MTFASAPKGYSTTETTQDTSDGMWTALGTLSKAFLWLKRLGIPGSTHFEQAGTLLKSANHCEFRESCHGTCAGRRRLQDALLQPDSYCPVHGQRPTLQIRTATIRDLPKLSRSYTTVVIAR